MILFSAAVIPPVFAQDDNGKFAMKIGGGMSVPINPTANYAGVGGDFLVGGGYSINKHNAVLGEFLWAGLPPNVGAAAQLVGAGATSSLYSLTANYRYSGSFSPRFGFYLIGGGGWYYRHVSLTKNVLTQGTVCQPIYNWYGYTCTDGLVNTNISLLSTGTSAFGVNAGAGLTIRISDGSLKFFIESRYNYAASRSISTQVAPVTFGFQYH
jgi:hypothetical protein